MSERFRPAGLPIHDDVVSSTPLSASRYTCRGCLSLLQCTPSYEAKPKSFGR